MPGLFISYRHDDSAAAAGRLFDVLRQRCRADVFLDVTMRAGSDFRKVIEEKLDGCDVVLAVIGPAWLSVRNPRTGVRRLDEQEDYVRIELATAFREQKTVIPVLVGGATVPTEEEMPEEISALSYTIAI